MSTMIPQIMSKLWHFEIVKIGQNLHVSMEGFRRAGHIYSMYLILQVLPMHVYIPIPSQLMAL